MLFLVAISVVTRIRPELGPAGPRVDLTEKLATLRRASTIVLIVLVTIGGIYGGVMTPVEASGVGAF